MLNFEKADKALEDSKKLISEGKIYQAMDILKSFIKNAENVINGKSSDSLLDLALLRRQVPITNKDTISQIRKREDKAKELIEKYELLDTCKHKWKLLERLGMFAPEYKCKCDNCNSVVILCSNDHTEVEWEKVHKYITFRDEEEKTQSVLRLAFSK